MFTRLLDQMESVVGTLTVEQSRQMFAAILSKFEGNMWAAALKDINANFLIERVDSKAFELGVVLAFEPSPVLRMAAAVRLCRNVYKEVLLTIRHEFTQEGLFDRCQLCGESKHFKIHQAP